MKNYDIDLRREGLEGFAVRVRQIVQEETRDFRQPIRFAISDASGAVFSSCDDGLVRLGSGLGQPNPAGSDLARWPLVLLCSDADGNEFTMTIGPESPRARAASAP